MLEHNWGWDQIRSWPSDVVDELIQADGIRAQVNVSRETRGG